MKCEEKEKRGMPELSVSEDTESMERNEQVVCIRKQNEAVTYLRKRDCKMLTVLKDLLGENIRLNGILNGINAEIARLNELLETPKPKFKFVLLLVGLALALLAVTMLDVPAFAVVGLAVAVIPFVLKAKGNKKWQAFMDETNAALRLEEEKAARTKQQIEEHWANQVAPYIAEITPDRFPAVYAKNYDAVCGMLYAMENLMANTIHEAVNHYEQELFRNRMKQAFNSMESSLRDTARSAARSAAAAERSAAANESAAASAAVTAAASVSMAKSTAKATKAVESASRASKDASRAIESRANRD